MTPILPGSYITYDSQGEVYVCLVLQYHHVRLDQISMDVERSNSTVSNLVAATCIADNPPEDDQASAIDEMVQPLSSTPYKLLVVQQLA